MKLGAHLPKAQLNVKAHKTFVRHNVLMQLERGVPDAHLALVRYMHLHLGHKQLFVFQLYFHKQSELAHLHWQQNASLAHQVRLFLRLQHP